MHYSKLSMTIISMVLFLTSSLMCIELEAKEPATGSSALDSSSPIVVSCFYSSCDSWETVCSGEPIWIANLSVDVTDPNYTDEITLSLANAPSGMSISSQSYDIGPNYPDDFNHIYANVDPSLIPGSYTYDIVLTMTDGSSTSYTVTSSFEQEIACDDESACNYQPFSMCWGDADCEYPDPGFDCEGNALISVECYYNSCTSYEEVCPGSPHWIANLSVDHGDPNYSGEITLSLSGAPEGMTISSQSYDIGPDFPDDFNHIYATIPESVSPGQYTYDIVLTDTNGGSTTFAVTTDISFATPACSDFSACNYEPGSMCDDWSSCEYPEFGYDCEGSCLNDADGDGICDEFEITGCTDANAVNYVAEATDDDGSCDICYTDPVPAFSAQVVDVFGNGLEVSQEFNNGGNGSYALIEGEVYLISFWYCEDEMMGGDQPCNAFDVYPTDENGQQGSYMPTPSEWVGSSIVLFDSFAEALQGENPTFESTIEDTFGNGLEMADVAPSLPSYISVGGETYLISFWYCEDEMMGMGQPCTSFDVFPADENGQQGGYMATPESWVGEEVQFFYNFESTQSTFTTPAQIDECGVCGGAGPEEGFDCEGNPLDLEAIPPVINAPESNSEHVGGLTIELTLPEEPQDGSVVLTFTQEGGTSDEVILNIGQGTHTISFDLDVNVSDLMQVSTSTFGDAPIDAVLYDLQLTYNDLAGNAGSSSAVENVNVIVEVPGCTDAEACNYNAEANSDDGSCIVPEFNIDCDGNCLNAADLDLFLSEYWYFGQVDCETGEVMSADSSLIYNFYEAGWYQRYENQFIEIVGPVESTGSWSSDGCTITVDVISDALAQVGDNFVYSTEFGCFGLIPANAGCVIPDACNYDPDAELDNSTCYYAASGYDCDGNCLSDSDGDGVCDALEVAGCTNPDALNYVAEATDDDGSCEIEGCTYSFADNYNPEATNDDGSCIVDHAATCGEGTYYDEDSGRCLPISYCDGDLNEDGEVSTNDLLMFLGLFGLPCE